MAVGPARRAAAMIADGNSPRPASSVVSQVWMSKSGPPRAGVQPVRCRRKTTPNGRGPPRTPPGERALLVALGGVDEGGLGRGEPRDRDPERRARHVIETE